MSDASLKTADAILPVGTGLCAPSLAELKSLSGEELAACMKAGHQDALAILFDRYHRLVLSIALKILRDPGEAEDLMQSVFFEVYRIAAQFDPAKGNIKTWIAQCAYHRSLNRRHYLNARAAFGEQELDEAMEHGLPPPPRATAGLTHQEIKRLVEQGLAMLNPPQKETLNMAFFEGLSMAEIAARRKESVVNVRHHYYRGLARLRTLFYRYPLTDRF